MIASQSIMLPSMTHDNITPPTLTFMQVQEGIVNVKATKISSTVSRRQEFYDIRFLS